MLGLDVSPTCSSEKEVGLPQREPGRWAGRWAKGAEGAEVSSARAPAVAARARRPHPRQVRRRLRVPRCLATGLLGDARR